MSIDCIIWDFNRQSIGQIKKPPKIAAVFLFSDGADDCRDCDGFDGCFDCLHHRCDVDDCAVNDRGWRGRDWYDRHYFDDWCDYRDCHADGCDFDGCLDGRDDCCYHGFDECDCYARAWRADEYDRHVYDDRRAYCA